MKKIVNGKLYDTSTATEVDSWWEKGGTYQQYGEWLYRKQSGEYFLYIDSYFADRCSIIPINVEKAKEWVAKYSDADIYAEEWGLPKE
ncbi:MAG: hypothetical protein Q4C63_06850 [Eubacteriales bacterium]|nr:hypothetical protein [Eubacteriales bacterium]